MSMFDKLFGRKDNIKTTDIQRRFYEKDNAGLRFETYEQAEAYWINRNVSQKFDPFIISIFRSEEDARKALLSLNCMHVSEDTGKIICTETLFYGYFKDLDSQYNTIIGGSDLSHDLWEAAKSNFSKYGGIIKTEQEPNKQTKKEPVSSAETLKKVQFVREDRIFGIGGFATYRIYYASDADSAKAFLQEEPVTKNLYYIVVETPEGNYCRDIQGIYKE